MIEVFATMVFTLLCLEIRDTQGTDHYIRALAVALSLYFAVNLSVELTGAALNPTIGLVQNVFLAIYDLHEVKSWKQIMIHSLSPLLGGLLAAPLFMLVQKARLAMDVNRV